MRKILVKDLLGVCMSRVLIWNPKIKLKIYEGYLSSSVDSYLLNCEIETMALFTEHALEDTLQLKLFITLA